MADGDLKPKRSGAVNATVGALAAVALWLGFYALGIAIIGALLWVPWAEDRYEGSIGPAGIFSGVLAAVVAWGLFPRPRKKEIDGEPLARSDHPRLHTFVSDVAGRLGVSPPDEIHLTPSANAFARSDSRWGGFAGKRVIGIGLPLLRLLDREELASVIAHELGHHHAGHTRLGPWVHGVRVAIAGTLDRLEGSSFWLHLPFVGYARFFLWITSGASRRHELHADAVAAGTCGAGATRRALSVIHDRGPLWGIYFGSEVLPLARRGFLPPLLDGFDRFNETFSKQVGVAEKLEELRKEEDKRSIGDTHPPLATRLEALGESLDEAYASGPSALDLLDDVRAAEDSAMRSMLVPGAKLTAVEWNGVAELVLAPVWRELVAPYDGALRGIDPSDLADVMADAPAWISRHRRGLALLSPAAERRRLATVCGAWLTLNLAQRGFVIESFPGAPVRATKGELVVEPFDAMAKLEKGALSAKEWRATCSELLIGASLP